MRLGLCSFFLGVAFLASLAGHAGITEAVQSLNARNYKAAFDEFSYLASEGDATAAYYLGYMHQMGLGIPVNFPQAMSWFQRAAEKNNLDAVYQMGMMYLEGKGVPKNVNKALDLLKTAGRNNHAEALYQLGEVYAKGTDVKRDYPYAYGYYQISALEGYAPAQYKLGLLFLYGRGVPQDYQRSVRWLRRAADQGYVFAQRDLAELFATDRTLINPAEAYAWYNIIAAYNSDAVGDWAVTRRDEVFAKIKNSEGLLASQEAARKWRPKQPKDTVPQDEYNSPRPIIPGFNDEATMSLLRGGQDSVYIEGARYGITRADIDEAILKKDFSSVEKKVENSARQGHTEVFAYLGDVFTEVVKDPVQAFSWYQRGATEKDATSMIKLASLYCGGKEPVDLDLTECYKWLYLAEKNAGVSVKVKARENMQTVEKQLSEEEKKQARESALEWENERENRGVLKRFFK